MKSLLAQQADSFTRITVTSDTDWTWIDDATWITSTEQSPQNGSLVSFDFAVTENTTGAPRVGTITFTSDAGDIVRTLVVTQAGTLTISETQHVNTFEDTTRDITVFAAVDVDWVWSSNATWLNGVAEASPQTAQQDFTYNVSENTTGETRVGTITFQTTSGDFSATLEVTQLSNVVTLLELSDSQQASSYLAQDRSVEVITSPGTAWVWETDSSWISADLEAATQTGSETFTYDLAVNNTGQARIGTVTFKSASGDVTVVLEVTQFGVPLDETFLDLSASAITVGQEAVDPDSGDLEVTVSTNSDWSWESDSPWLVSNELPNQGPTVVFGENTENLANEFNFGVTENTTGADRIGILTFTYTDESNNELTKTLVVTQAGSLSVSESEHVNSFLAGTRDVEVFAAIGENWLWSSDVDWLSSGEALSQTGSNPFTYAFSANESGESRVGTLTFFSSQGGATATLQVTQLSGSTLSLELSTTEQVVLSPADSKDIGIVSNTEWTWISDAAWLSSAEDLTQTNDQTFTYSVVENNTAEDRVGSITFFSTSGGIIRTLTVTQLRGVGNFLILSDEQLLTDFTAKDPLTVEVISNTNWLWESSDSWLTAGTEDLTQNGTQTLTYEVAENTTGATRTATLTFRTEANDVQVTLTVTQLSGTGTTLNLSETTLVTDFTAKTTLNVGVSSNTTWVWQSSDPTWLTAGTEGLTQINDQTFEYEVAQNTTGTNRTATLTFTSQAGDVTAVLEVTQLSGAGLTLNLSETARVTGAAANAALTVDVSSNTDWLWSSDADWLTQSTAGSGAER